jgi:hypothetical protein
MPTTIPSWFTVTSTPLASAAIATGTRDSTRVISGPKAMAIPLPETASVTYSQAPPSPPERSSNPDQTSPLLSCLAYPPCCSPVEDQDKQCVALVGQLRGAYGRHVGDPVWTHFIRRLEALSPTFTAAWAAHEVAQPTSHTKHFRHPSVGRISTTSTSFAVAAAPGARMVIYTPLDEQSGQAITRLAAGEELTARFPCWSEHNPHKERTVPTLLSLAPFKQGSPEGLELSVEDRQEHTHRGVVTWAGGRLRSAGVLEAGGYAADGEED